MIDISNKVAECRVSRDTALGKTVFTFEIMKVGVASSCGIL